MQEIMGESSTGLFDFSDDLETKPVEWSTAQTTTPSGSGEHKRRGKKTSEQLLAEIMEETLLVLEEQTEEFQAKLLTQNQHESQDYLYYKDLLSKMLTSFEDITRQANVTYKRFQALQLKEPPLIIATRGYNVEALPPDEDKLHRKKSKKVLSSSTSTTSLSSISRERKNSDRKDSSSSSSAPAPTAPGSPKVGHSRSTSKGIKNSPSQQDVLDPSPGETERELKDRDREKEKEKEKKEKNAADLLDDSEPFFDEEVEPYLHKINNGLPYRSHFWDTQTDKPQPGQLNFLGEDPKLGPIAVSIIKEKDVSKFGRFRVLIWTREGCFTRFLPVRSVGTLRGEILSELITPKFSPNSHLTWVPEEALCHALLKIETEQAESGYKFGVVYVKEGQTKEDDMFSNSTRPFFLFSHDHHS